MKIALLEVLKKKEEEEEEDIEIVSLMLLESLCLFQIQVQVKFIIMHAGVKNHLSSLKIMKTVTTTYKYI